MTKADLIDIDILAIAILIILIYSIGQRKNSYSYSTRLFLFIVWGNLIILILESLSWLLDGTSGLVWRWIIYSINYIYLVCNIIPAICWLCYLDYQLYGSIKRLKKRMYYFQPAIIFAIVLLITMKSGFIFFLDKSNSYARGPGFLVFYIINYSVPVYAIIFTITRKKSVEKRLLSIILTFCIIPIIGGFLQLIFYGLSIAWPSMVLAVLITYLFLELQQETRDYLTGLNNRQQIDEWISYRIRRYDKHGDFTLVMIDLNDFKYINDNFGHDEGDNALIIFSDILSRSLKRRDMVARFAGDEFVIVLETGEEDEMEAIISRIDQLLIEYMGKEKLSYKLSFSYGSVVYNSESSKKTTYQDLLREADSSMYKNKRNKKNQ